MNIDQEKFNTVRKIFGVRLRERFFSARIFFFNILGKVKTISRPSAAARRQGGQAPRLGWARGPGAAARTG